MSTEPGEAQLHQVHWLKSGRNGEASTFLAVTADEPQW
jgi:hypothetical protein